MVELSKLKGCVVTIDVHPELRGRVGKVDGDVVVSARVKTASCDRWRCNPHRTSEEGFGVYLPITHAPRPERSPPESVSRLFGPLGRASLDPKE